MRANYYFYIDNYRGFSRTVFPAFDMNFLVGENSTGKSSLLKVLDFFGNDSGLFSRDSYQKKLGSFEDAVSKAASDKSYFKLGLILLRKNRKKIEAECAVFRFTNEEGMPVLSSYSQCQNKLCANLWLGEEPAYRFTECNSRFDDYKEALESCIKFIDSFDGAGKEKANRFRISPGLTRLGTNPEMLLTFASYEAYKGEKLDRSLYERTLPVSMSAVRTHQTSPIRPQPQRYYDGQNIFEHEGDSTTYIKLNKLVKELRLSHDYSDRAEKLLGLLNSYGNDSGLFDGLSTRSFDDAPTSPFEVLVDYAGAKSNIKNVGYGVSQVLPILMDLLDSNTDSWYLMQQPEVHLHPRAQAAFGGLLFDLLVAGRERKFFAETHSDFIIDRFRLAMSRAEKPPSCQVLYCERDGAFNKLSSLVIGDDGRYPEDQPDSYKRFFLNEALSMLGL